VTRNNKLINAETEKQENEKQIDRLKTERYDILRKFPFLI
jgi:hypothetical protein